MIKLLDKLQIRNIFRRLFIKIVENKRIFNKIFKTWFNFCIEFLLFFIKFVDFLQRVFVFMKIIELLGK